MPILTENSEKSQSEFGSNRPIFMIIFIIHMIKHLNLVDLQTLDAKEMQNFLVFPGYHGIFTENLNFWGVLEKRA